MVPTSTIEMTDLSQQITFETDLSEELTPEHTVDQAVARFRDAKGIPDEGLRWMAFSRGVRLEMGRRLRELPETDAQWLVMPEVSAA